MDECSKLFGELDILALDLVHCEKDNKDVSSERKYTFICVYNSSFEIIHALYVKVLWIFFECVFCFLLVPLVECFYSKA